jgi:hypothetical protein
MADESMRIAAGSQQEGMMAEFNGFAKELVEFLKFRSKFIPTPLSIMSLSITKIWHRYTTG